MRTTIDGAGRVVIPKSIRDRLGLAGGTPLEISEEDGKLTLERPAVEIRLTRTGRGLVAVAAETDDMPPLTGSETGQTLDEVRTRSQ
jgi:AbrB family looped-hinge helix DNA binding protein